MQHVYCPECGFQNPESANYCAKCGALLVKDERGVDTTMTLSPEELEAEGGVGVVDELRAEAPTLVVRSGGGRTGESFVIQAERTTIGRSPECDVFLDDVTVSRRHAAVVGREGRFFVEDLGSLNGTFLNRARIESAALSDGDELQVGKYRLVFLTEA